MNGTEEKNTRKQIRLLKLKGDSSWLIGEYEYYNDRLTYPAIINFIPIPVQGSLGQGGFATVVVLAMIGVEFINLSDPDYASNTAFLLPSEDPLIQRYLTNLEHYLKEHKKEVH